MEAHGAATRVSNEPCDTSAREKATSLFWTRRKAEAVAESLQPDAWAALMGLALLQEDGGLCLTLQPCGGDLLRVPLSGITQFWLDQEEVVEDRQDRGPRAATDAAALRGR